MPAELTVVRVTMDGLALCESFGVHVAVDLLDLGRIHTRVQANQHCVTWAQYVCEASQEIRRLVTEKVAYTRLSNHRLGGQGQCLDTTNRYLTQGIERISGGERWLVASTILSRHRRCPKAHGFLHVCRQVAVQEFSQALAGTDPEHSSQCSSRRVQRPRAAG